MTLGQGEITGDVYDLYKEEGVDKAWFYLNDKIRMGLVTRRTAQAIIEEIREELERRYRE